MAYNTVNELFTAIANAIRTKTGKTEKIASQDMPTEIENIQAGGGDDYEFKNCNYLFFRDGATNGFAWTDFDNVIKRVKQPTSAQRMYYQYGNGSQYWYVDLDRIQQIVNLDYSKCTNISYLFDDFGINAVDSGKTLNINMDLSACTTMAQAFKGINYGYSTQYTVNVVFNFNGTTGKVTGYNDTFRNLVTPNVTLEINNINMDAAGTPTSIFNNTNNALSKLTFKGSFGGNNKSTATATLDLSTCTLYTIDALLETMTSISPNESGKTRIFKLSEALYNEITDEIWDLADEKLYELSC